MTRESLRRLVEKGLDQNQCPTNYKGEEDDVTISPSIFSNDIKAMLIISYSSVS